MRGLFFIFRVPPTRDYARKSLRNGTLREQRDLLSLPTREEKKNRCFERRRTGNAPCRCNDYARASEKLIARSIREKPKGFGDCDVALITVNLIFHPLSSLQGVRDPQIQLFPFFIEFTIESLAKIRCGIFLF